MNRKELIAAYALIKKISVVEAEGELERARSIREDKKAIKELTQKVSTGMKLMFRKQLRVFMELFNHREDEYLSQVATESRLRVKPNLVEAEPTPDILDLLPLWQLASASTATEAAAIIQSATEAAYALGGRTLVTQLGQALGLDFDLDNPAAIAYLEQHGAVAISMIDESTFTLIKRVVIQGTQEGLSWVQVSRNIITLFEDFNSAGSYPSHIRNRAQFIAVTEIGNAFEAGQLEGGLELKRAGLPMEKAYVGPSDSRTSTRCQLNLSAGWIEIESNFPSGIQRPLDHPGCRHGLLIRVKP